MKSLDHYKKYILISSGILFLILIIHLIGVYIYSDGKFVGVRQGSISIGIVGTAPDIKNPFEYGTSANNNLMYRFLFRSLLYYNPQKKEYEGDLSYCDISDITKITCTLRENALWSDGTRVTGEDIIATYTAFSQKSSNPKMKQFLEGLKIEKTGTGQVVLSHQNTSPLMVEVLEYPIIRSDIIDQIKNNRLNTSNYVSSGPFVFKEIVDDETYKFKRVSFGANPHYDGTRWLEGLSFKFFDDVASLERAIDTVTVIIPPKLQENITVGPRFKTVYYIKQYELFGAFFRDQSLPKQVQKIIFSYLYNALYKYEIQNQNHSKVTGIFAHDSYSEPEIKTDIQTTMKANGYKTKQMLREEAKSISTDFSGGIVYDTLKYVKNGDGKNILYLDDPSGEFRLRGNVPSDITSVVINGYTLREYKKGNGQYIYKASLANGALKQGKNTFEIILQRDGKEDLKEVLTLYYSTDKEQMKSYKKEVEEAYRISQNTPEKKAERETKKQEKIKKIEMLEENAYYNIKGEKLVLKVAYIPGVLDEYMDFIEETLSQMSVQVQRIPLEGSEVSKIIKENKNSYDILLIGIEAPKSPAQVLKNFVSSEAENGINFSNIKSKNLDTLIDSLRTTTDTVALTEISQKIEAELMNKSLFIPMASPLHSMYIDKNIKGFEMPKEIRSSQAFANILDTVSISDRYELNMDGKSIFGFFGWIADHLRNH